MWSRCRGKVGNGGREGREKINDSSCGTVALRAHLFSVSAVLSLQTSARPPHNSFSAPLPTMMRFAGTSRQNSAGEGEKSGAVGESVEFVFAVTVMRLPLVSIFGGS